MGISLHEKITKNRPRLLHDGRARNFEEAILWHGGEAKQSRESYMNLDKNQREKLIKFLRGVIVKKIFLILIFLTGVLFANETIFQSVIKNVALKDTQSAINSAKKLQKELNDENFTKFLKDWKRVEANYLAGEINSDYLDTPRYIDVFNNLKEDLNSQMQRVIDGNLDIKKALFKNSFKTINALEYLLYSSKELNDRKKEIGREILNSIIKNLEDIKTVYETYLKNPIIKDDDNAKLINTLVASLIDLKEWRIGNPAGFSTKYKNDAKNSRAEYFLSQNSFEAIDSIFRCSKRDDCK